MGLVTCLQKSGRFQISDWKEVYEKQDAKILALRGMRRVSLALEFCVTGYWPRLFPLQKDSVILVYRCVTRNKMPTY